jgi:hypothetical protein
MSYSDSNTAQATTQENTGLIDKFTGVLSGFFKSKSSNTLTNEPYKSNTDNTSYTGYGGARSRRRKCNKKHRHTKSCRKYVKKGRKTRKH